MATFLTTNGVSHHLEELVRGAEERLFLVSPYLKINDRFRDLLAHRLKRGLKVRLLYGKKRDDLPAGLETWLADQPNLECRFRPHLHGKCYVSEVAAVVTSMNLYEYSQQTNDEFGVRLTPGEDRAAFTELVAELNRVFLAAEPVAFAAFGQPAAPAAAPRPPLFEADRPAPPPATGAGKKVSTSQLAKRAGVGAGAMFARLAAAGLLDGRESRNLTAAGVAAGGEVRSSARFGDYVVWPETLTVPG